MTWTTPVATPTKPRFFAYDSTGDKSWTEIDPDADWALADDRVTVQVDQVRDGFRLSCTCFYGPEGRCELVITYPLGHALAIFGRLIDVEADVESGLIAPVALAA